MSSSETVSGYFGVKERKQEVYGLEIEMECFNSLPMGESAHKNWQTRNDGSLRGPGSSVEYVLLVPVAKEKVPEYLELLQKQIEYADSHCCDSVRAGTHIHINASYWNINDVRKFLVLYYIVEELLVDFCGEGRQGNHFCLRVVDSKMIIQYVRESFFETNEFASNFSENLRYCALNLNALSRFGSLEFRALRTPMDLQRIAVFVQFFSDLTELSKTFSGFEEVLQVKDSQIEALFSKSFGKEFNDIQKEIIHYKLRQGRWLSKSLCYL